MLKLLYFIFLILFADIIVAQNVTNAQFYQENNKIRIVYNLDKTADISVYMSSDGGNTYGNALKHVSGDVGEGVKPGSKTIIWNVLDEMDKLYGEQITFKVIAMKNAEQKAKEEMPRAIYCTANAGYSVSMINSFGAHLGFYKRIGYYVSFMSDLGLLEETENISRLSFMGGVSVPTFEFFRLYIGAGYGFRSIKNENYEKETHKGMDFGLGLMMPVANYIVSAEAVLMGFKCWEFRVGVGFCFTK